MGKNKWKELGLKCGIEIHTQLDTEKKLFCNCKSRLSEEKPKTEVVRKLRPVAGETGDIDIAALHETFQGKEFHYQLYPEESCLVEIDEEPIHPVNPEALETALKIALMLKCEIPEEIHVMRKAVLDGSNTSGFQRTALVGLNGSVDTSFGKVGITNVCVEEDSAQIIEKKKKVRKYGLDRLAIPLVEIGTTPDVRKPKQAKELASKLGMILKSTGKIKKGVGTIRQDLNVSIKKGGRAEIKGVQSLGLIPKVVEKEVKRQKKLVDKGKKVKKEVRRALKSGKSKFLRPLPGAARLYPETDVVPIRIDRKYLKALKKELPELIEDKTERLAEEYKIGKEMAKQLVSAGRGDLMESLAEVYEPKTVANILTSYWEQLKSEGVKVENLTENRLKKLFKSLKGEKISKETLIELLEEAAEKPGKKVSQLTEKVETFSEEKLEKIVDKVIKKNKKLLKRDRPEKALMGLVMKEVRGKAPGSKVMKILKNKIKKK